MSEHTPGPWEIGPGETRRTRAVYKQGTNWLICETGTLATEANAALIAAAPELLEALQVLLKRSVIEEGWSGSDPIFEQASLAIAKALKVSR